MQFILILFGLLALVLIMMGAVLLASGAIEKPKSIIVTVAIIAISIGYILALKFFC